NRRVKDYHRETDKMGRFTDESNTYRNAALALVKTEAIFFPLILLLIGLSTVITVYVGGLEVAKGTITSGNIAEFIIYVNQLTFPAMALAWVTSLIQRAAASQKRINEFLRTQPEIHSVATGALHMNGHIQFEHVSFTYPDTGIQALNDVSFEVKPGEVLAIVGKTGSGKSTLANLLMRMYDVQTGTIRVDGSDIRQLPLQAYRSQIGFVPQDVFLFSDSIGNNIAFGLDNTDRDEVENAAPQAAVHHNIAACEKCL